MLKLGVTMPLFEFKCPTCGRIEERLQKYSDAPPMCQHRGWQEPTQMERMISACNHELKGTGWYKTDFKGS